MRATRGPLSDGMDEVGTKGKGVWWPPRSLGRLMTAIALSGLAMAAYANRTRTAPPPVRFAFRAAPPGRVIRLQAPAPRDPAILIAPSGIDDAMIVTARSGIDDAMIVTPGRRSSEPILVAPVQPGPGQVAPWRPVPPPPTP